MTILADNPIIGDSDDDTVANHVNLPSRPMLARDADSIYWMSRYVERAEHVARLLLINSNLMMDMADLAPELQRKQWQSVLNVMFIEQLPDGDEPDAASVNAYMALNPDNTNSILSCLTSARENARAIRENISHEMWEHLNTLYWSINAEDAKARLEESPEDFYTQIMTASMLFQGLTDATIPHAQRWHFTQLSKYLERTIVTARIIQTKYDILRHAHASLETPVRNILWMSVLRACCSIEAYRRHYLGDLEPLRVVSFMLFERNFPRSIRYCVQSAYEAMSGIRAATNPSAIDAAERILGRLNAEMEYAEMNEVLREGIGPFLQRIQNTVAEAAMEVQKAYFLRG